MKKIIQALLLPIVMVLGYTLVVLAIAGLLFGLGVLLIATIFEPTPLVVVIDIIVLAVVVYAWKKGLVAKGLKDFWQQLKRGL